MKVAEWLQALSGQGVELWFEGDRLRFRAPAGALAGEQRAELSARRGEVLAYLREEAAGRERSGPLSFTQQSLWFLHQQAPHSTAYHVALPARVLTRVDEAALQSALQALVDRHASLRTTYVLADGSPEQRIAGAGTAALERVAVPGLGDAALRQRVEADYRRPFDLEHGPLLRASLFTRGPEDHVLLVTVHHIAADGWSLLLLFEELFKLYGEATGGPAAGLTRPEREYTDYASWQARTLAGPEGERLWAYWREKLAPPRALLDLPADRSRPAKPTFHGASLPLQLDAPVTERLKKLALEEGTTAFVVLLAAFQAFLFRLTGTEDVVVGTPTFSRSKPEFMRIVGDFVNSVPLRAKLAPEMTFRELIRQLRRTVHEALDAQDLPLPVLVQRMHPDRDSGRSPVFNTFFILQRFDAFRDLEALLAGGNSDAIETGGLRLAAFPIDQQDGQFDLALQMLERGGSFHGALKYSTDLFDPATAHRFAGDCVALAEAAGRDPDIALGALPRPAVPAAAIASTTSHLLERLQRLDVVLHLEGDKLRLNAPRGVLDAELRAAIADHRGEIIAALSAAGSHGTATGGGDAIRPIPRRGRLPVSAAQQRLWLLDRIDPGRPHYNIGISIRLRGPLDPGLVSRAIDELVRRHETLRTRLVDRDGLPEAEILPPGPAALEVLDLAHLPASTREDAARRHLDDRLRRPFDLAVGPLTAYLLVRLDRDDHILLVGLHHAIGDGWSLLTLVREFCRCYDALAAGRPPALPPLDLQYVDYAAWEKEQLSSSETARHLSYWKQQLAGAPTVIELPSDRPRPATPSFQGHYVRRDLDPRLLEGLKRVSREHDATLFMALVASWQVLLHRYSGQDDVVIGSPITNREHLALEGIVGCFVNNLVLRGHLAGNPTFFEFLEQVKRNTLDAFDHRNMPFDVVVEAVRPARSASHAPIFQVLFTLHSFPTDFDPPAGLTATLMQRDQGTARFDLSLEMIDVDSRFTSFIEYASDLFDEATIRRMHAHFEHLLQAIVDQPRRRVDDLPLLTAEDERLLLGTWNDTALAHDRSRCLHQLLEATARRAPDAAAVTAGGTTLAYRDLDQRANRLARLLVARGVTPGALVAVCVDRSVDMPVALAAVLKAGAAYVPLDPSHPADRLRYTLADAGVACAITLSRFAPLLADAGAPLVLLDDDGVAADLAALPATPLATPVNPEDLAYVIYTSGSTGRPKGVEVEHRNVVSFLEAMRREPGFTDRDVLLAVTTLSFDIAGLEFWLPLGVGGRVVVASRGDVLDGERLAALLEEHAVTVMQATPATWRLMLEAGWTGKRDLRALCGGEALPRDLAAALKPRTGELWNMYGPTETTIWSTVSRVEDPATPTIGRPIHNTRVYVLEPSGQLAPIGVLGELCIGGEGVARGYRNRPELSAEKFVTVTLPGGRHERVYRTGDVARFRADGQLDFLGRRDHQVKVRGYRIELGEIEAVLATHPGVKEAVVSVREDRPGDQRLVGYVVASGGATFDAEAARATLRRKLPDYMIPNLFLVLDALPLTPSAKIDRKALPAPGAPAASVDDGAEALMTPVQRRVAAVWREVLRAERVGLHDNFFDLGGHSLLLVKLHAALRRELGSELTLVELFQWTTVAAQSDRLTSAGADDGALRRAQARAARQAHA